MSDKKRKAEVPARPVVVEPTMPEPVFEFVIDLGSVATKDRTEEGDAVARNFFSDK